jgi:soluble lytic murein transglycosylase-like protein
VSALSTLSALSTVSAVSAVSAGSARSAVSGVDAEVASSPFGALFVQAGARHGVPPSLLEAVAQAESGFDPTAVSPVGAQGLMQIMPGTARELGVDPMDPAQAVDGAARLLRRHIDRFGSLELALAAYNAGPGAVDRFDGVPPYRETQDYVRKILADLRVAAPSGAGSTAGGGAPWSGPGVMGTSGVPTLMAAAAPGAVNGADQAGAGPFLRRLRCP